MDLYVIHGFCVWCLSLHITWSGFFCVVTGITTSSLVTARILFLSLVWYFLSLNSVVPIFNVLEALRSLIITGMISESTPVHSSKPQSSHLHMLQHFPVDLLCYKTAFFFLNMFLENVILATASDKPSIVNGRSLGEAWPWCECSDGLTRAAAGNMCLLFSCSIWLEQCVYTQIEQKRFLPHAEF